MMRQWTQAWTQVPPLPKFSKFQHFITICDNSLFEMPNCHVSNVFITKPWLKYGSSDVLWVLVDHLGLSLPRKSVVRLTDRLDMTIDVDWDVKPQHNKTSHY